MDVGVKVLELVTVEETDGEVVYEAELDRV